MRNKFTHIKKFLFVLMILMSISLENCKEKNDKPEKEQENIDLPKKLTDTELESVNMVLIETEFGNMKIKFYDQTPLHKKNFIKLANNSFFNDLLFHRVINEFMIQGGDPDSKTAAPGVKLGNGGPGYDIAAEFNDSLYHKKGVIAAAREGDDLNPEKKSSGSQFYLVQGKKYNDEELNELEKQTSLNDYIVKNPSVLSELHKISQKTNDKSNEFIYKYLKKKKDFVLIKIPEFKRIAYKEIGGIPFLDNNYTVFGEIIEGIDVIDKIAATETDKNKRPLKNIKMKIKPIIE